MTVTSGHLDELIGLSFPGTNFVNIRDEVAVNGVSARGLELQSLSGVTSVPVSGFTWTISKVNDSTNSIDLVQNLSPIGTNDTLTWYVVGTSPIGLLISRLPSTAVAAQDSPSALKVQPLAEAYFFNPVPEGTKVAFTGMDFAAAAPAPSTMISPGLTVLDTSPAKSISASTQTYSGPVSGIQEQYVAITADNLNITATTPNWFIHTGSGNDAIDVSKAGGNNILDGSTGSNFLTGGSGNDTFFVDDRNPTGDVFSTVVGFHSGDNATVFGVNPGQFTLNKLDNQGAARFTGLDFAFSAPGHANANIVLAGYSTADLVNGRLTATYGTTPDAPGAPGSQYLLIHAN